jgi:murein L,D-transpeptidase YafK
VHACQAGASAHARTAARVRQDGRHVEGEIYALAREALLGGQRSFQVQAYPFRMTPLNLAKHRNSPHMAFWRML